MRLHKPSKPVNGTAKRRLPDNYICIAPEESLMVFDYLNGRRDVDKKLVALHLNLCHQCQDAADSMRVMDDAVKERLALALALV
jgi:hypothetical protein